MPGRHGSPWTQVGSEGMSPLKLRAVSWRGSTLLRITFIATILSNHKTQQKGQKELQSAMTQSENKWWLNQDRLFGGQPGTSWYAWGQEHKHWTGFLHLLWRSIYPCSFSRPRTSEISFSPYFIDFLCYNFKYIWPSSFVTELLKILGFSREIGGCFATDMRPPDNAWV